MTEEHCFIAYEPRKPNGRIARDVAVALMNYYCTERKSRSGWLKEKGERIINCYSAKGDTGEITKTWDSKPISVRSLDRHLASGRLDHDALALFEPICPWLDTSLDVGFHQPGVALTASLPLGRDFPIHPKIDREGYVYMSLQLVIMNHILKLRDRVVRDSHNFTTVDWFQDLRAFVCECVSLIDTTLHQLYYKAQYDPPPGWTFDEARLGGRFGRRLRDKLRWVFQITGNDLEAHGAKKALWIMKGLRNHLQHLDPPCFCYTIEDVVGWLNLTADIALVNWDIRKAVGSPLNNALIEMLLAPRVVLVPRDRETPRAPQPADVGYASTRVSTDHEA